MKEKELIEKRNVLVKNLLKNMAELEERKKEVKRYESLAEGIRVEIFELDTYPFVLDK